MFGIRSTGQSLASWRAAPFFADLMNNRGGRREEQVKIDEKVGSTLLSSLRNDGTQTLIDMANGLVTTTGVEVHPSTIGKFLHRQDPPWRRKKSSVMQDPVDVIRVFDLHSKMTDPNTYFMMEDETSIVVGEDYDTSWAPAGERATVFKDKSGSKDKLNIAITITKDGLVDYTTLWSDRTEEVSGFHAEHISNMLWSFLPTVPNEWVLGWDNASIHTSCVAQNPDLFDDRRVYYLPPYCPQFNPVEPCNNSLKGKVKKYRHSTRLELFNAVRECIEDIDENECAGFFEHAEQELATWISNAIDHRNVLATYD
jgi:transposase